MPMETPRRSPRPARPLAGQLALLVFSVMAVAAGARTEIGWRAGARERRFEALATHLLQGVRLRSVLEREAEGPSGKTAVRLARYGRAHPEIRVAAIADGRGRVLEATTAAWTGRRLPLPVASTGNDALQGRRGSG